LTFGANGQQQKRPQQALDAERREGVENSAARKRGVECYGIEGGG